MPKIMKNGIEYGGDWDIYSDTETKIGKFLGKDLYRKVFKLTNVTSSDTEVSVSSFGANVVTRCYAVVKLGDPATIAGNFPGFGNGYCYYNVRDNKFHFGQSSTGASIPILAIVVEYIKEAL